MKTVIETKKAPGAIGPYSQAVKMDKLVFVSGQIPVDPATGEVVLGGIEEQAEQSLLNLKNILEEAGSSMENVLKTTVFLKDMNDFSAMNKVYGEAFADGAFPARSAVQAGRLPKDVLVEIEAIASV